MHIFAQLFANKTSRNAIIIGTLVLAVALGLYLWGRSSNRRPKRRKLPTGGMGIPTSGGATWNPEADILALHNAMKGWGTDEEAIFYTLEGKTNDQKTAIANGYGERYNIDLLDAFRDELSGTELRRALSQYTFMGR